ncbi:metal-dependent hydrolase [Patescibacteria group bacterium]|nr:metal-dependent hydrolase [Patescibacteria group bacterium]
MDIISHAVWGATIIREQPQVWWAALFGALPDFWASIPVLLYLKKNKWRKFNNKEIWAEAKKNSMYLTFDYISHSLFTASVFAYIVFQFFPSYWYITIPYFVHIVLDVFVHRGKWGVRLFYPLSNWHINGVNWWETKWISAVNWTVLIAVNLIIWLIIK